MIIPVKKYLFLGSSEELNLFFNQAQQKGMIQFIPALAKEIPKSREIQDLMDVLRILKHYPVEENVYPEGYSNSEIVKSILDLQNTLIHAEERKLILQAEIFKMQPLGDFSFQELKEIETNSNKKFFFYFSKRGSVIKGDDLILINTDHEFDFYMGFSSTEKKESELTLIEVTDSLGNLKKDLQLLKDEIKKTEIGLKNFAPFADYLRHVLIEKSNEHELIAAKEGVAHQLDGRLFVANAWIPENKTSDLVQLTLDLGVYFEEIRIEENDRVPTCMINQGLGKVGEDLVHIYDVPSHEDKDPSRWVLFAFALFFAMIISDAGYGMLYLLSGLFLHFKFKSAKGVFKRTIRLINIVACFSVFWGVMACSYFSIPIAPDSIFQKFSGISYLVKKKAAYHIQQKDDVFEKFVSQYPQADKVKDPLEFVMICKEVKGSQIDYPVQSEFTDNILLELSLMIGIIHISLSFLRNIKGAYAGIGWIISMIGGYLYFPIFLNSTSLLHFVGVISKPLAHIIGSQLLLGGFGLAVLLAIIQNKAKGLAEILTSIQVFADVLSYLRLYALGLAGMIMASTFNSIGQEIGFVTGALITIVGHIVNITLGIMGGVIHGLRLNFLEWYHYSFQGGGKLFSPLSLLKEKSN